ncbi:zinc ABC transporter, periplasmic zinc-binding protein [Rhodobacterales bacterium HTCC2150]|nr:zinc ABC transporter, periplasmic zinc-binding protein [Rhodobacterales bacterium HTCC2150] [Rhodobacteraceae bacterium HTCC2150]
MRAFFVALLGLFTAISATNAQEAGPKVVTDIAPVGALVAMVLGDEEGVSVLLPENASVHSFSLRPSQARNLQRADAVIWIGPSLSPWLERSIENLAPDAISVPLISVPNTLKLIIREDIGFIEHEHHGDHDEDHEDAAHDEGLHNEDAEEDHEGEGHEEDDDHDNMINAATADPHAWLEPNNAVVWLDEIAHVLGEIRPEFREIYAANAQVAAGKIMITAAGISEKLADVREIPFLLAHDGTQYFEHAFGVAAQAAIRDVNDATPSVRRLHDLGQQLEDAPVSCVMLDNESGYKEITLPSGEMPDRFGTLRSMGQGQTFGPDLYIAMLNDVADTFVTCLKP